MTLQTLTDNVKALKVESLIGEVLQHHEQDIMELQRVQLLEGHDNEGKDIHPFYTEDLKPQGYFKSRESAERYAAWKESLSYPYSVQRNTYAPNLYITGVFHNELAVRFNADSLVIAGGTAYANKIVAKYGLNTFGLSQEKWNVLFNERGAKDEIINLFKTKIYGS